VRIALGAAGRDILAMILRETGLLLGGGLLLGLPLSYEASRAISSQLFGLSPGDIFSFTVAVAALASVMALGCILTCAASDASGPRGCFALRVVRLPLPALVDSKELKHRH